MADKPEIVEAEIVHRDKQDPNAKMRKTPPVTRGGDVAFLLTGLALLLCLVPVIGFLLSMAALVVSRFSNNGMILPVIALVISTVITGSFAVFIVFISLFI
jgi:uncharacterized membrane protein